MNLSDHFTLAEATRSMMAQRHGIENTPNERVIENMIVVAENVLEPIRATFGPFTPSSWFRSMHLNDAIGGSKTSQHMTGCAVDIEITGVSNWDLARWIYDNLTYDQLILEFMVENDPVAGWVHCSYVADGGRLETLRAARGHGYFPFEFQEG